MLINMYTFLVGDTLRFQFLLQSTDLLFKTFYPILNLQCIQLLLHKYCLRSHAVYVVCDNKALPTFQASLTLAYISGRFI